MIACLGVYAISTQIQQQPPQAPTDNGQQMATTLVAPVQNSNSAPEVPGPQAVAQEPKVEAQRPAQKLENEPSTEQKTVSVPDPEEYQRPGKHRTALLSAARKDNPKLKGTLFYSPAIITDGHEAFIISEARTSYGADPVYAAAYLSLEDGAWVARTVEVSDSPGMARLAESVISKWQYTSSSSDLARAIATDYDSAIAATDRAFSKIDGEERNSLEAIYAQIEADYDSRMEAIGKQWAASTQLRTRIGADTSAPSALSSSTYSTRSLSHDAEQILADIESRAKAQSEARQKQLAELAELQSRNISVGWSYTPRVAENGSYYGQISNVTYRPRTIYVSGYYRRDGTYVRSHFRSRR